MIRKKPRTRIAKRKAGTPHSRAPKSRRLPFGLTLLAFLAALGGGGYFTAYYFFPLETVDFLTQVALWRGDVNFTEAHGLEAFSRNHCVVGKPCGCVALIHGLGDQALTWKKLLLAPARAWGEPLRLYAWNLPGTGRSATPSDPADYRARIQAQSLSQAMREVCPKWTVVGNSLGGWIATWVVLDHPELVERLVLVDSWGLKKDFHLGKGFELSVEALKEFQRRAYFHPRELPDRIWAAALRRARTGTAGAVRAVQVSDDALDSRLGKIRTPTLIVWGDSDRVIERASGQLFRKKIPKAHFREFAHCGHMPQKECPGELISAINDFFVKDPVQEPLENTDDGQVKSLGTIQY